LLSVVKSIPINWRFDMTKPFETHADIDPITESYILTVSEASNIYELDIDHINDLLECVDSGVKDLERLTIPDFVRTLEKEIA